jgi:hypothetical protein
VKEDPCHFILQPPQIHEHQHIDTCAVKSTSPTLSTLGLLHLCFNQLSLNHGAVLSACNSQLWRTARCVISVAPCASLFTSANFSAPAAFEDFLKTYKTSTVEASDALQGLNINDDELDEDYDFMDESGDEARSRRPDPKMKYMRMMQNVSDRSTSQVIIDLDDLAAVRCKEEA